jgi:hypothetical protein
MRRTYRTLNDCEMQHNAEVGLFTKPSELVNIKYGLSALLKHFEMLAEFNGVSVIF